MGVSLHCALHAQGGTPSLCSSNPRHTLNPAFQKQFLSSARQRQFLSSAPYGHRSRPHPLPTSVTSTMSRGASARARPPPGVGQRERHLPVGPTRPLPPPLPPPSVHSGRPPTEHAGSTQEKQPLRGKGKTQRHSSQMEASPQAQVQEQAYAQEQAEGLKSLRPESRLGGGGVESRLNHLEETEALTVASAAQSVIPRDRLARRRGSRLPTLPPGWQRVESGAEGAKHVQLWEGLWGSIADATSDATAGTNARGQACVDDDGEGAGLLGAYQRLPADHQPVLTATAAAAEANSYQLSPDWRPWRQEGMGPQSQGTNEGRGMPSLIANEEEGGGLSIGEELGKDRGSVRDSRRGSHSQPLPESGRSRQPSGGGVPGAPGGDSSVQQLLGLLGTRRSKGPNTKPNRQMLGAGPATAERTGDLRQDARECRGEKGHRGAVGEGARAGGGLLWASAEKNVVSPGSQGWPLRTPEGPGVTGVAEVDGAPRDGGGESGAVAAWVSTLGALKDSSAYAEVLQVYGSFLEAVQQGSLVGPTAIPFNIALSAAVRLEAAQDSLAAMGPIIAGSRVEEQSMGASSPAPAPDASLRSPDEDEDKGEGMDAQGPPMSMSMSMSMSMRMAADSPQEPPPLTPRGLPRRIFGDMLALGVCPNKATLRLMLTHLTRHAVNAPPCAGIEGGGSGGRAALQLPHDYQRVMGEQGADLPAVRMPYHTSAAHAAPASSSPHHAAPPMSFQGTSSATEDRGESEAEDEDTDATKGTLRPLEAALFLLSRLEEAGFGDRPLVIEWMAQIFCGRPYSTHRLQAGIQLATVLCASGVPLSRYTVIGMLMSAKQLRVRHRHSLLHAQITRVLALSRQALDLDLLQRDSAKPLPPGNPGITGTPGTSGTSGTASTSSEVKGPETALARRRREGLVGEDGEGPTGALPKARTLLQELRVPEASNVRALAPHGRAPESAGCSPGPGREPAGAPAPEHLAAGPAGIEQQCSSSRLAEKTDVLMPIASAGGHRDRQRGSSRVGAGCSCSSEGGATGTPAARVEDPAAVGVQVPPPLPVSDPPPFVSSPSPADSPETGTAQVVLFGATPLAAAVRRACAAGDAAVLREVLAPVKEGGGSVGPAAVYEDVIRCFAEGREPLQAVSWLRRMLGATGGAVPARGTVRVLLGALRRKRLWREMMDVGALLLAPGDAAPGQSMSMPLQEEDICLVIRTLLDCNQTRLAVHLFLHLEEHPVLVPSEMCLRLVRTALKRLQRHKDAAAVSARIRRMQREQPEPLQETIAAY